MGKFALATVVAERVSSVLFFADTTVRLIANGQSAMPEVDGSVSIRVAVCFSKRWALG